MKSLLIVFAVLAALYCLFIIWLYFNQGKLVYLPPVLPEAELKPLSAYQRIEVKTEDDLLLKAYFLKPAPGKPVILVFHGNASHPVWKVSKFHEWALEGYGFLLAEYRGYDGNPGIPSESGLYKDGDAYLKWIKNNPDLAGHPIVVYGESLGSGVAVDVASKHANISALILEVTFSRLSDVGAWHYPYILFAKNIMTNKFPNEDKIKKVKAPVLFLLAGQDEVVPIHFGQKLAELANEPKEIHVFKDASHAEVYSHGAGKVVDDFLKKHFP